MRYEPDEVWIDSPPVAPERAPVAWVQPSRKTYVAAPPKPHTLPALPYMADDGDDVVALGALRAVQAGGLGDAHTQARASIARGLAFGVAMAAASLLLWATLWLMGWGVGLLELAGLLALAALNTALYLVGSEKEQHRHSPAGVERLKIQTAAQIHADRLEARERMHAAAVGAWERVLLQSLQKREE